MCAFHLENNVSDFITLTVKVRNWDCWWDCGCMHLFFLSPHCWKIFRLNGVTHSIGKVKLYKRKVTFSLIDTNCSDFRVERLIKGLLREYLDYCKGGIWEFLCCCCGPYCDTYINYIDFSHCLCESHFIPHFEILKNRRFT